MLSLTILLHHKKSICLHYHIHHTVLPGQTIQGSETFHLQQFLQGLVGKTLNSGLTPRIFQGVVAPMQQVTAETGVANCITLYATMLHSHSGFLSK